MLVPQRPCSAALRCCFALSDVASAPMIMSAHGQWRAGGGGGGEGGAVLMWLQPLRDATPSSAGCTAVCAPRVRDVGVGFSHCFMSSKRVHRRCQSSLGDAIPRGISLSISPSLSALPWVISHFTTQLLPLFLADTHYRNQFETHTSNGALSTHLRTGPSPSPCSCSLSHRRVRLHPVLPHIGRPPKVVVHSIIL